MITERFQGVSRNRGPVSLGLMVLFLFFLAGCATNVHQNYTDDQSYIDDVEYLYAYGRWVDYPPHGMVWLPDVVSAWEPFYYGHWIWTDDGWAWTSYEPFGWLVYHYGYWGYEPGFGWFWVPGDTWYPACVQWYTFDIYTAWAPLPPPGIVWPDPWDPYDVNIWIVVDVTDFTNEDIGQHRVVRPVYRERVQNTRIVRRPPDVKQVERVTRRTMTTVRIREEETTIQHRAVSRHPRTVQRREPAPDRSAAPETEKRRADSKQQAAARREPASLKKLVLPRDEERKVEKHAPRVEREVLKRREKATKQQRSTQDRNTETNRKRR
jgi:hypothetical protein